MKKEKNKRLPVAERYWRKVRRAERALGGLRATKEFYDIIDELLTVEEREQPVVRSQVYYLLLKNRGKINLRRVKV